MSFYTLSAGDGKECWKMIHDQQTNPDHIQKLIDLPLAHKYSSSKVINWVSSGLRLLLGCWKASLNSLKPINKQTSRLFYYIYIYYKFVHEVQ